MATLQDKISQLQRAYGNDVAGLTAAVQALVKGEHERQQSLGITPFRTPTPSTPQPAPTPPIPSTSAHASNVSSRGRTLKPVQPYQAPVQPPRKVTPAPQTPLPMQPVQSQYPPAYPRPGSSLNPNVHRPPTRVPLSSSPAPVPPMSRISESRYQASYTTYPARMRLGVSSLMQPNFLAADGKGSNTPSSSSNKRSRTIVNYAEMEALEDSGDESNDSDRKRGTPGYGGMVPKRVLALGGGANEKGAVWGDGKSYLGSLPPGNLVIVQQAKMTKHVAASEDQLEEQAEEPAMLVPIQIDIDVDTFKIRDAFVWNINEKIITPESFAKIFCEDLDIPSVWVAEVAKQIAEQIEEQTGVAEIPVRSEEDEEGDVEKDLRVVLNLDVQIGTLHLVDRVEWDLSSPLTPELFASILVRDLSLSSSAAPLISHALHEELFRHKKNCLEMGLVGESAESGGRVRRGAKMLEGVWREWNDTLTYGPRAEVLSLDEMDRVEADRERASRRQKRDRLASSRTAGRRR